MEGAKANKRVVRVWLWICVAFMLISMVGASLVQSSGGNVIIKDFQLVVSDGKKINAQIYVPKDASAEHKLPLVIAQHGSQHNLEMQDMNMVELSRRGYIVISSDAFRHGSSTAGTNLSRAEAFSNVIYMVDYASEFLDIVDTDKIGLVGHSMGAAIVTTTLQHFVTQ
ncbi:MAG: alpha/beta hydrolase, partial [Firmicutes bacterium HGW-Firmicutes-13]